MIRNVWAIPYFRGILGLPRWPVLTPRSALFRFLPCPSWVVWRFNAREYWAAVTGRRGAWRGCEADGDGRAIDTGIKRAIAEAYQRSLSDELLAKMMREGDA